MNIFESPNGDILESDFVPRYVCYFFSGVKFKKNVFSNIVDVHVFAMSIQLAPLCICAFL